MKQVQGTADVLYDPVWFSISSYWRYLKLSSLFPIAFKFIRHIYEDSLLLFERNPYAGMNFFTKLATHKHLHWLCLRLNLTLIHAITLNPTRMLSFVGPIFGPCEDYWAWQGRCLRKKGQPIANKCLQRHLSPSWSWRKGWNIQDEYEETSLSFIARSKT